MTALNVLIIGNGGREHALAWKLSQSPRVGALFAAPGNAGAAELGANLPIDATDVAALVTAAKEHAIDLAVVGPEAPLAAGAVDALTAAGIRAFGPTRKAAEIESSKSFARSVMEAAGVRCAEGRSFDDRDEAAAYVRGLDEPPVVKADGLAAGKGVVVADSTEEALAAVDAMMVDRAFGEAGSRVVIEERLPGVEASVLRLLRRRARPHDDSRLRLQAGLRRRRRPQHRRHGQLQPAGIPRRCRGGRGRAHRDRAGGAADGRNGPALHRRPLRRPDVA